MDFEPDLSEFGFEHVRYFRDGLRQLIDDAGNAIFVTRGEVIITLYSRSEGTEVDELEITKSTKESSWSLFDIDVMEAEFAEEEAEKSRRLSELKDPWNKLIASLPPLSKARSDLAQAVRNARQELELCLVWNESRLSVAHDALDSIKELAPEARISELLKLIVTEGQRLSER